MGQPRSPRDVFLALVHGVAEGRWAEGITIHETTDPEVIIAEFEYRGTVVDTGKPFVQPAIFVLRVRDGEIVSSRDYFDHVTAAAIRGRLDDLVAAVKAHGA